MSGGRSHATACRSRVLQNCVIFNDKTHAAYAGDKTTRQEHTITLRHGEKMLFGADQEKGLALDGMGSRS